MKTYVLLCLFFCIFILGHVTAQDEPMCLQCHGQTSYKLYNEDSSEVVEKKMYSELQINYEKYKDGVHSFFGCTDCHSPEYESFPHSKALNFEPTFMCIDCHGGDEQFAKYHFEGIQEEFNASVHSQRHKKIFNCWMCHDPHSYQVSARIDTSIQAVVAYDNDICLSCHADIEKFAFISGRDNPNIIQKHEWLPNQELHFKNVRCIECHTKINDTIMVAHLVRPKEMAVKNCVECHSQNSILMSSLYKFKVKESRSEAGFLNAVIINESFVIGANRNVFLNTASVIIFILVLIAISIHILFRYLKTRKDG